MLLLLFLLCFRLEIWIFMFDLRSILSLTIQQIKTCLLRFFVRCRERSLSKQTTHVDVDVLMWCQQIYTYVCNKRNATQHENKLMLIIIWRFKNNNKKKWTAYWIIWAWIFALIVKSQTHALNPIFAKATKTYRTDVLILIL